MGAATGKRSTSWLRGVPGFRSHKRWVWIAAGFGYAFLLLSLIVEVSSASLSGILIVLGVLAIVFLAGNAWGIRTALPIFRSPNKLIAAGGWCAFLLVWFTVIGITAPATQTTRSPKHSSETALALSHTPSATTTPTATPTPTPTATPTPTPPPPPSPTPTPRPTVKAVASAPVQATKAPTPPPPPPAFNYCGAPANPWHYNFCGGSNVYNPPNPAFCNYFGCIASFWNEDIPNDGYVVQCVDGAFSLSGGERGSCSYHGGVSQPLYAP